MAISVRVNNFLSTLHELLYAPSKAWTGISFEAIVMAAWAASMLSK